jgi:CheY-like chemotaxis protein
MPRTSASSNDACAVAFPQEPGLAGQSNKWLSLPASRCLVLAPRWHRNCTGDSKQQVINDTFVLQPELILIDVSLNRENGFDALRFLRHRGVAQPATEVVLNLAEILR